MLPAAASAAHWPWDRANGVHEATWGVAFLFGPALGGLMIAWVGALDALWVTAVGFGVSSLLTVFIRVAGAGKPAHHERPTGLWSGTVEGLVMVWRQPVLRSTTLISCLLVAAYISFESVILPVYINSIDSPKQLGAVVTAMSAGAVVGSLAYPALVELVGRHRLFIVSVGGACLSLVGLATLPTFLAMVALALLVGLLWGPVQPILNMAMQVLTEEPARGRVIGVIGSVTYAAGPLGLLAAGPTIDAIGVRPAALTFAGAVLVAAVLTLGMRALKGLDDLDQTRTPAPQA